MTLEGLVQQVQSFLGGFDCFQLLEHFNHSARIDICRHQVIPACIVRFLLVLLGKTLVHQQRRSARQRTHGAASASEENLEYQQRAN